MALEVTPDVFCSQGKCEKRVQDVIERFWEFIDKLSINTFGMRFPRVGGCLELS